MAPEKETGDEMVRLVLQDLAGSKFVSDVKRTKYSTVLKKGLNVRVRSARLDFTKNKFDPQGSVIIQHNVDLDDGLFFDKSSDATASSSPVGK